MEIGPPRPPQRAPHYFWVEHYGFTPRQCALNLVNRFCLFAREADAPLEFRGDVSGLIWRVSDDDNGAKLEFTSNRGLGEIILTIDDNDWVRIELFLADKLAFRAWAEDPYEEKEFWPDGADGVGEAPGRLSKRGTWLNIERARFPGVIAGEASHVLIEDVEIVS